MLNEPTFEHFASARITQLSHRFDVEPSFLRLPSAYHGLYQ